MPSGTPTAGQEALQAPTIDPVQTLANIPLFGVGPSLLSLIFSGALDATGSWMGPQHMGRVSQMPFPVKVEGEIRDQIFNAAMRGYAPSREEQVANALRASTPFSPSEMFGEIKDLLKEMLKGPEL